MECLKINCHLFVFHYSFIYFIIYSYNYLSVSNYYYQSDAFGFWNTQIRPICFLLFGWFLAISLESFSKNSSWEKQKPSTKVCRKLKTKQCLLLQFKCFLDFSDRKLSSLEQFCLFLAFVRLSENGFTVYCMVFGRLLVISLCFSGQIFLECQKSAKK